MNRCAPRSDASVACCATCQPHTLAAGLIRELVRRTGLSGDDIDDVVLGQGYPNGEAPAIGRVAALDAGLGRACPASRSTGAAAPDLQAVLTACMQVPTGAADLVLAGGAESMSQTEFDRHRAALGRQGGAVAAGRPAGARPGSPRAATLSRCRVGWSRPPRTCAANWTSAARSRTRSRCSSHQRAVAAQRPECSRRRSSRSRFPSAGVIRCWSTRDEHPRADTSVESLARLRPVRLGVDPEATVTAGNASGQNDGAAVCIVTTPERASRARTAAAGPGGVAGRWPACRRRRWASGRCPPRRRP